MNLIYCLECDELLEKAAGYVDIFGNTIELKDVHKYNLLTVDPLCQDCFEMYQSAESILGGVIR